MKRILFAAAAILALAASCSDGQHVLQVVTTGDVHGSWFDQPYVEGQNIKTSLMSVSAYVDSLRTADGKDNVLLLDAGDILQGDNAAYYYNYVVPEKPHLYPQIAAYMGYDAAVVGNHDIETGHPVYDKLNSELKAAGIPWLGGNAIDTASGKPYFPVYKMFKRAGLNVAVLGFTNPNMSAWLDESLWTGIDFKSLIPIVQEQVDAVISKEKPDVVIVVVHSGTGKGDGSIYESQGLDLLNSLTGVDLLVTSHDHNPVILSKDSTYLVNGGARAGYVGRFTLTVDKKGGKVTGKQAQAWYQRIDKTKVDEAMEEKFAAAFEDVKAFTLKPVGELAMELRSGDAYRGMCDYMNLIHTVQLSAEGAQISFAAPLSFNGVVKSGPVIFNDMFTIYPYENQLFVVKMKGSEIKDYLEYSYASWIVNEPDRLLNIETREGPGRDNHEGRAPRWSFVGRSYNFDSAGGLVYTVDVTKPQDERISIKSLADGSAFDPEAWYNVAMTSYRASGGGMLLTEGAGIPEEETDSRVVAKLPEIRNMIYKYIEEHNPVTPELVGDKSVIGEWKFVPEKVAGPALDRDYGRLFPDSNND